MCAQKATRASCPSSLGSIDELRSSIVTDRVRAAGMALRIMGAGSAGRTRIPRFKASCPAFGRSPHRGGPGGTRTLISPLKRRLLLFFSYEPRLAHKRFFTQLSCLRRDRDSRLRPLHGIVSGPSNLQPRKPKRPPGLSAGGLHATSAGMLPTSSPPDRSRGDTLEC